MMKVLFLGNSQSVRSNCYFRSLAETPCELVGVVDAPPSKRRSTNPGRNDFPSFVEAEHRNGVSVFAPLSPNTPEFVNAMGGLSPDLFIAVGYTNILGEEILSVPRAWAVNFHASLLPAYRGKHPVFWTLRHGERWAGLTVHVMDPGIDTGDIIYQVKVRTRADDSVETLYDRIMSRSVNLMERLIAGAEKGKLRRTPQSDSGASYYSSAHEDDFNIDWSRNAGQLRRWIQTTPGQCFCQTNTAKRVWLVDAEVARWSGDDPPGTILKTGRTTCTVAAGKGALRLRRGRLQGGEEKPMAQVVRELGLKEQGVFA